MAFHLLSFVVTAVRLSKCDTGMDFRLGARWPGLAGVVKPIEMEKSQSRDGGTGGAAVPPKTTDLISWEVNLPW
jgi:hypothetical protein